MIAACPTCGARYRIDTSKLRPEGSRLRCTRCETVFRVQAPSAEPPPTPLFEAPRGGAASTPDPAAAAAAAPRESRKRERLVLVASPEEKAAKQLANTLSEWGLEVILVHDGVEAILNIQRALPRAVVLDAALPKMFGFQVCELMKRNESLREIMVVLVGAIHDERRYRRPPEDLYGADAYAERHQLPDALHGILQRFGLPLRSAEGATGSAAAAKPASAGIAMPAARAQAVAPPPPAPATEASDAPMEASQSPEREQAERLARIIVSDIILYNQEKFDAGVRAGNVAEALASELAEGHALFAGRVNPAVGDPQEFLKRELLRIARSKGMN